MWNLSPLNCSSNTPCLLHLQVLSSPTSCHSECGKEAGARAKESNIQKVFSEPHNIVIQLMVTGCRCYFNQGYLASCLFTLLPIDEFSSDSQRSVLW